MVSNQKRRYQLRHEADLAIAACRLQLARCRAGGEVSPFEKRFYVMSLWWLREVARNLFERVQDQRARGPYETFNAALPYLEELRGALTHSDPDGETLRDLYGFSDVFVRLRPGEAPEYLLDLVDAQKVAETLYRDLCELLQEPPD
jgi:hypothetical protein